MTRVGEKAIAWAKHEKTSDADEYGGLCQYFTRMTYDTGGGFPTAAAQWYGANSRHFDTNGEHAPRARAFCWTGGSSGFGHIAPTLGGGVCLSNDWRQYGHIDYASINEITRRWGLTPRGWIDDVNEHNIVPDGPRWENGEVYVSKLRLGTRRSRSVSRLQYRLKHHTEAPTPKLVVTGNYGSATRAAVERWQRKIGETGPNDGKSITENQARRIFGTDYQVRK